jgi:hypothetical protein
VSGGRRWSWLSRRQMRPAVALTSREHFPPPWGNDRDPRLVRKWSRNDLHRCACSDRNGPSIYTRYLRRHLTIPAVCTSYMSRPSLKIRRVCKVRRRIRNINYKAYSANYLYQRITVVFRWNVSEILTKFCRRVLETFIKAS